MDDTENTLPAAPNSMLTGRFIKQFFASQGAASAVEFALVAPVVLLMFFGAIGGGILAYATVSLQRATEEAARCMSMDRADLCTSAGISAYGQSLYSGPGLTGLAFSTTKVACGYRVSGTGSFAFVPGLTGLSVTLQTSACYPGIRA